MEIPKPEYPITPTKLDLDDTIQFQCHKGIACFNKCCQDIDITLTPYDVLRLKNHLDISSREFLDLYTVPFEMDAHGMPGIKLKTQNNSTACQFVTDEGCTVYSDRPASCRYYAMGLMSMRRKDSPTDEDSYFIVKEDHCLGHEEPREITVRDYRKEQGLEEYDELSREWRQIVLKKRSCGPTLGQPTDKSFQLFFMASYDLDNFKKFIGSASFKETYDLDPGELDNIIKDDIECMKFSFRFMRQVFYGEKSIELKANAVQKRVASKERRIAIAKNLALQVESKK